MLRTIKNKRVLILNDGRGKSNYGLDLTSESLIDFFKLGGNEVSSIPSNAFHGHPSLRVHRRLYNLILPLAKKFLRNSFDIPYSLDNYKEAEDLWFKSSGSYKRKIENQIKNSDIVVFNAEGTCHSNNYGARVGLFLLYIASLSGKKTYFINGTTSFYTDFTDILLPVFKNHSKHIHAFYLREKLSEAVLKKTINKKEISYLPDTSFKCFEDYEKTSSRSLIESKYFLVSSSMNKPFKMLSPESLPLGKVVDRLARQFGKPIFIVKDPEDHYITKFARSRGYQVYSGNDRLKLFSLFRHASFLLSGRFHHIILASINGCPTIAMNTTSWKNEGLLQTLPKLSHSQELINPSSLISSMESIVEQAELLSKPAVRSEAAAALLSFSKQQYDLLNTEFGL